MKILYYQILLGILVVVIVAGALYGISIVMSHNSEVKALNSEVKSCDTNLLEANASLGTNNDVKVAQGSLIKEQKTMIKQNAAENEARMVELKEAKSALFSINGRKEQGERLATNVQAGLDRLPYRSHVEEETHDGPTYHGAKTGNTEGGVNACNMVKFDFNLLDETGRTAAGFLRGDPNAPNADILNGSLAITRGKLRRLFPECLKDVPDRADPNYEESWWDNTS